LPIWVTWTAGQALLQRWECTPLVVAGRRQYDCSSRGYTVWLVIWTLLCLSGWAGVVFSRVLKGSGE
jgi:hypothetical protein